MARIILQTSGIRELQKNLIDFPRTSARFFDLFLTRVSKRLVSSGMKNLWPGHGVRTGNLQGNIKARRYGPASSLRGLEVRVGVLGSEVEYAAAVEEGHRLRNGKRWKGYHYMGKALKTNERYIANEAQKAAEAIAEALTK